MSLGVLLTRAQPFTIAHKSMIELMLKENEEVLIIIGSADKYRTQRNPFTIIERIEIVKLSLGSLKETDYKRIKIMSLNDWENENNSTSLNEWGSFLYYNIVSKTNYKRFNFYYSEKNGKEFLDRWFVPELRKRITYKLNDRSNLFNDISATKVRHAILNDDEVYLSKSIVPLFHSVLKTLDLKNILENIKTAD